jgi:hypothetical protein
MENTVSETPSDSQTYQRSGEKIGRNDQSQSLGYRPCSMSFALIADWQFVQIFVPHQYQFAFTNLSTQW